MPMSARHGGAAASSESSPTLLHEKPSEVSVRAASPWGC